MAIMIHNIRNIYNMIYNESQKNMNHNMGHYE